MDAMTHAAMCAHRLEDYGADDDQDDNLGDGDMDREARVAFARFSTYDRSYALLALASLTVWLFTTT